MRFCPYGESEAIPNIVVDGSPNAATVLTLTHWPGIAQPDGLAADLSAEMAFNYIAAPPPHAAAEVVTNNHFDQDGLASVYTLTEPEAAQANRERLIDLAAAGDFATYQFREAARASMTVWAYAQPDRSPLGSRIEGPYDPACALLYETMLPLVGSLLDDSERYRDLWAEEDEQLTASERAIADGQVSIDEVPELDLAIVNVNADDLTGGHRFASSTSDFVHPMALHNATNCCRLLVMRGHQYLYADRYETWVQYQSRRLPRRVDLAPLAAQLEALEASATTWSATPPSGLTPELRCSGSSSLDPAAVQQAVIDHLRTAPPAWDPFRR